MTLLATLVSFFPLSVLVLLLASIWYCIRVPDGWNLLLPIGIVYLYPVLAFRFLSLFKPLSEGRFELTEKKYNAWWGSHQFQLIYFACPFLEGLLRTLPGVYSAWLRLWGARIGKQVYWTPNVEIDDRPLVEIGDGVIVGHKVHFISHVILPYKDRLSLYIKKISIGKGCFLGAGSRLGPGVVVDDGTTLPVLTDGHVNQHFSGDQIRKKPEADARPE
ncbi:MAG: acyl transferase [Candidatus Sericytochromatia bacterium]